MRRGKLEHKWETKGRKSVVVKVGTPVLPPAVYAIERNGISLLIRSYFVSMLLEKLL